MLAGGTPASTDLSKEKSQTGKSASDSQRQTGRLQPVDHRQQSSASSGQQMQGPNAMRASSSSKVEASKAGGSYAAEQEGRIPAVPRMADKLVRKEKVLALPSSDFQQAILKGSFPFTVLK